MHSSETVYRINVQGMIVEEIIKADIDVSDEAEDRHFESEASVFGKGLPHPDLIALSS